MIFDSGEIADQCREMGLVVGDTIEGHRMTTTPGAGPMDLPVSRHALDIVCLHCEDYKTLMSKGHHDPDAFTAECEKWNGSALTGWGKVRHGWHRSVPDRSGVYRMMMTPAKPHARGAYPTTTIVDCADYDD